MNLERNKQVALRRLIRAGDTGMTLAPGVNHGLWLGVGFAVAKGWATYKGDDRYQITSAGKSEMERLRRNDLIVPGAA